MKKILALAAGAVALFAAVGAASADGYSVEEGTLDDWGWRNPVENTTIRALWWENTDVEWSNWLTFVASRLTGEHVKVNLVVKHNDRSNCRGVEVGDGTIDTADGCFWTSRPNMLYVSSPYSDKASLVLILHELAHLLDHHDGGIREWHGAEYYRWLARVYDHVFINADMTLHCLRIGGFNCDWE